ncbi:MAG: gas vesicle protein GvpJ [Solirubrobacterales bacterium]
MATAMQSSPGMQPYRGGSGYVARSSSSGLYDVLELILDKGLVIDVFVRVSLIGIEILTIDARIVIASVDTYLRFAEAVNRLDLMSTETQGLPELMDGITEGGASKKTKGMLQGAKEALFGDEEEEEDEDEGSGSRRRSTSTTTKRKRRATEGAKARSSGGSRSRSRSAG